MKTIFSKASKQFKKGNFQAALKNLDKIKAIDPNCKKAHYLEANIYDKLEDYPKEYETLQKLLSLLDFYNPEEKAVFAETCRNIVILCDKMYFWEEAIKKASLFIKLKCDDKFSRDLMEDMLLHANALENFSAEDFRAFHEMYKDVFNIRAIVPFPKRFYDHEKIRVGYLSSDFYKHVVMVFARSLLQLDENTFQIYCYADVKKPDDFTKHFRSTVKNWRDINYLTDAEAAKLIRDDEIDILVDLNGHSGDSRLPVAAYRPATVQISGIGDMNSTGLDCFDYFLSDVHAAGNPEVMKEFFTEKIIKLPHSHICYQPFAEPEAAIFPPCTKNGYITFGCFNNFGKITDSILATWKRILDAVPNSRLILKSKFFAKVGVKNFNAKRMKNFGFDLRRVEFRGYTDKYPHDYNDVDIALDPFPYTGITTTCDALFMGVPVVSRYGDKHGTRLGLSILNNVGLYELAVDSYDEYVKRAVALANDTELIAILKKNLRVMMKKSPLMDSAGYNREVEKVFIDILNAERNRQ